MVSNFYGYNHAYVSLRIHLCASRSFARFFASWSAVKLATPLELVPGTRRFLRSDESGDTLSSSEISRLLGREASTGIAAGDAFPRYGDGLIQLAASPCR